MRWRYRRLVSWEGHILSKFWRWLRLPLFGYWLQKIRMLLALFSWSSWTKDRIRRSTDLRVVMEPWVRLWLLQCSVLVTGLETTWHCLISAGFILGLVPVLSLWRSFSSRLFTCVQTLRWLLVRCFRRLMSFLRLKNLNSSFVLDRFRPCSLSLSSRCWRFYNNPWISHHLLLLQVDLRKPFCIRISSLLELWGLVWSEHLIQRLFKLQLWHLGLERHLLLDFPLFFHIFKDLLLPFEWTQVSVFLFIFLVILQVLLLGYLLPLLEAFQILWLFRDHNLDLRVFLHWAFLLGHDLLRAFGWLIYQNISVCLKLLWSSLHKPFVNRTLKNWLVLPFLWLVWDNHRACWFAPASRHFAHGLCYRFLRLIIQNRTNHLHVFWVALVVFEVGLGLRTVALVHLVVLLAHKIFHFILWLLEQAFEFVLRHTLPQLSIAALFLVVHLIHFGLLLLSSLQGGKTNLLLRSYLLFLLLSCLLLFLELV